MSHGMRSIELDGSQDGNGIQADPFISGLAYWFGDSLTLGPGNPGEGTA